MKKYPLIGFLTMISALALVTQIHIVNAGPLADYGDAADDTLNPGNVFAYPSVVGRFPSFYNTANVRIGGRRGPYHLTTNMEWLGNQSSITTLETDALIIDNDTDDCNPMLWVNFTTGVGFFVFDITVSQAAPDVPRYVNILYDQNQSGEWRNEWVVQNRRVSIPPGQTRRIVCGYLFSILPPLTSCWTRITLTREPIDPAIFANVGGWDGSGPSDGFAHGETEDWLLAPRSLTPPPPPCKEFAVVNTLNRIKFDRCHYTIQCNNNPPGQFILEIVNPGCANVTIREPNWILRGGWGVNIVATNHVIATLAGPWPVPPVPPIWPIKLPVGFHLWILYQCTWQNPCQVRNCQTKCRCGGHCASNYTVNIQVDPEEILYDYEDTLTPIFFQVPPIGGIGFPVDKLALVAPYIGLASTIMIATVATAIYVKRVKRREKK